MRVSESFIQTRKEMPKDATMISHKLLIKGGFINMSSAGVYTYLPLYLRVHKKVEHIIREEMQKIGAQELLMPVITPKEIWEETGRWQDFGEEMYRLKDRKDRWFALAPTHEEIITDIARGIIKSYKQLPQIWYQIQTKFRDEPRPRSGLLRVKQFEMKDSYSFDKDFEGLNESYEKHKQAYINIFKRCGIDFKIVEAASGLMGGKKSEEFMAISPSGEDEIVICNKCDYAANTEVAHISNNYDDFENQDIEKIHTPIKGDIESVSKFLNVSTRQLLKSILIITDKPIFVLIPGDREIDENKLSLLFGEFRYANNQEIMDITGAEAGFISPVGLNIKVYADNILKNAKGLISGANENDYHIKGINISRDIKDLEFANIIKVKNNDKCPQCNGEIKIEKCIEIGHIFQLGTKYSQAMNAKYTDKNGKEQIIVMGSYGIGLGRIVSTVIEQHHDKNGIKWPLSISPFQIIILPLLNDNDEIISQANNVYEKLSLKYEVLIDDRKESPGIKFKDADLLGIPIKIIIGKSFLNDKRIELILRENNEKHYMSIEELYNYIEEFFNKNEG